MNKKVDFLGVRFDDLSLSEAIECVLSNNSGESFFVVTPNVNILCRYREDSNFRSLVDSAGLVLNDSRVLRALAKFSFKSLPLAPGSDLTARLFDSGCLQERSVLVVGGDLEKLNLLEKRYGFSFDKYCPPMGLLENTELLNQTIEYVANSKSEIVFLALGSPLQEIIASRVVEKSHGKVCLCIGASIDFLTGKQKRAPRYIQKLSLEWLYRMLSEPSRLGGRYLSDFFRLIKIVLSRS